MEVVFERMEGRRYAIEVHRPGAPLLRMDPAPGFDHYFPHDLQHLIVEEQLGIGDGIFGRLAQGGTASTFHAVGRPGSSSVRALSRERRELSRRNDRLAVGGSPGFGRSERATFIAWYDWLSHCPEIELRTKADAMAATAESTLARMAASERLALIAALPQLRVRVDTVARHWASLGAGQSMAIPWMKAGTKHRAARR